MALSLLHSVLAALALVATLSTALPSHPSISVSENGSLVEDDSVPPRSATKDLQSRADKPFPLRIATLGSAIVNGYLSTDGNGFRKHFRDELRFEGWKVNMVGSVNSGTMKDNQNEGHPAWTIGQVTDTAVPNIVVDQPNLVLINVGTENAIENIAVSTIADEYIRLLDKLWAGIPDATVILSTLLVNKNIDTNSRVTVVNTEIRTTVMSHYSNRKIALADMNDGFITLADMNDDTHPNDYGYKKMASVWWAAFQKVELNGWLTAPLDVSIVGNSTTPSSNCNCSKDSGDDANMGDPHLPAYPPITTLATISFPDGSCSFQRQVDIGFEIQSTLEMAMDTEANLQRGAYFSKFFDQESRSDPDFAANTARVYGNIAAMLRGGSGYTVTATCDGSTEYCRTTGWFAHMNDDAKGRVGRVNFCDNFWTDPRIVSTSSVLAVCQTEVKDLRAVQRTRSAILLHELTHTSFAMSFGEKTRDYAYGYTFCAQLSAGSFDRSCMTAKMTGNPKIMCPDASGNEGICLGTDSAKNADTYAFVAAGVWYTSKCNAPIPLPDPVTKRSVGQRRASCPLNSDSIFIDGDIPIGQYVHFGDSYGAGMGTGTTSTDKCRVGSNNFGKLLHLWMNDASVEYVEKVCSGDTLTGLAGQISSWSNPGRASIGTLSIGGNDIGFSDLVWACVITPNTARTGQKERANCVAAEQTAMNYMSDSGITGLRYKLKEAYLSILRKSSHDYFHLYVTGYANFFNEVTTDCADSSFHYWWGGYKPKSDWPTNRIVHLTTDLRSELNTLVTRLNAVIAGAVSDANNEYGKSQVHFVDVEPSFSAGHRWCENPVGEFHEPDESRADTWFFLSAWKDVSISAAAETTSAVEAAEVASLISSGGIPLPNAGSCYAALGTDPDPYAYAMCQVAISIFEDPTGPEAISYRAAQAAIASGDFNSQEIPRYTPTRQIKTFHPRSPGMVAYRDAILRVIAEVGQL